jgi:hypothetical protein
VRLVTTFLLEPFPRDPAQEEARRELSKDIYRRDEPSFVAQVIDWVLRHVADLFDRASGSTPGGQLGLLVIVLLVVALIVAIVIRFGPMARTRRRRAEAAELEPTLSEDEHRRLADAFAAEGRYAEAVRERLRAIVRSLTDRGVLDNRPGRTATEIAAEAGQELPTVARDLLDAATLFGAIWYGRRLATAEHDAQLRAVDQKVADARPAAPGEPLPVADSGWAPPSNGPSIPANLLAKAGPTAGQEQP